MAQTAQETSGTDDGRRELTGLHSRLLEALGTAICGGGLEPGTVLFIEDLAEEHAVSRSVVREVLRVLASMGLVESRRRVGTIIQHPRGWNVYDPLVIRWRLAGAGRIGQLRTITELRSAVEPAAAALAAERAQPREASELVALAAQMWEAGQSGEMDLFLALDIDFHRRVLAASRNEMFEHLHQPIAEVLTGRHAYGLMPHHPHVDALQFHVDVAQAIQRHDSDTARERMVRIMDRTMAETKSIWQEQASDVRGTAAAPGGTAAE
ncbi:FadR/GntR family transcriptional regulator [Phycicoccus sp. Soil748]|uniref:FadR/GntR family transcriptional regulator n=1 Tax=Intrasporangiaceae TaxID=85021 RepID=UPI000703C170|nr:FCD domain-containing protein [Phycicoccus sp. Soil748]KRE57246.1 transcriptional regulator [Phycicoccus sp. Soil748]